MKHYGIVNPEGYNITNLTAPSGIADPANPNAGELFFRTDTEKLRIHNGTSWTDSDAGGFSELVGDTSPQLGGDLDVNGQSIISVSNGDITLAPDGTGVVTTTALYLASNVDASLSDDGPLVIGNKSSLNLNIDSNEIMARDNGGASILYLNHDGGDVLVGSLISFTVNEIFAVNGNIQCDTFVSHSGTAGTFSLYQNTETSETGPVLVMYGTTHASKGRTRLIGSTQTSSGTDVSHVFDNHNGTTTDNILTLYADKSATFSGDASINGTLNLGDADLSAYVSLKAPDTTTTSRTWVLPQDDPATAAGYFLKTDASGNMSFAIPSGSGMSEVIDDTTPQLGGNLDVNGQSIVSVSDGDINITPDGTGVVSVSGNLLLSENIIAPGGTDDTFVLFQNAAGSDVGPALTMRGLSATSDAGAFTFISCTNQNTGSKKTHRFINYFGTDYESWLDIYDNGLVAILGSASIGGSTSIGGNTSIGGTTTIDGDIVIKTDDGAATALIIWNSNTISVNPDIEFSSNGLISAEQSLYINVATSAAGTLKVGYGDRTNAATYVFEVGESVFQYNGNDILTTASGSGLSDIIEDITPQLGGDLDVNGKSIVSVDGNDITLVPSNIRAGTEEDDFTSDDIAAADVFGISSAIDGDTCIIGARSETAGGTDAGAAYVFTRTAGVWTQQQKIISSDLAAGDKFGYSVAIYGDTVVVGARYKNSEMGAVYVFTRSGSTWTQQQKLEASDKAINDAFGYGVTIYGDTVAVSAPYESTGGTNAGSVYVFTRTDTTWTEQQKLNPSPLVSYNRFGYSVSLYQDRLAVGAQGGGSTNTQGSAYTFTRTDTTWTQEQFITASDREYDDIFGWSICLYDTTLLVGASRADLVGDDNAGAAYFYKWSGSSWGSEQIVQASDLQAGDNFGYGVSVNNTIAIISSPWEDTGGDGSGAIYTFYYNGTAWVQQEKIQASDRSDGAKFGWSVAVNGNTGIIGAPITATGGDVYSFTFADESASVIIESNITSVPLGFQESGSGTDVIALVAPDSVTTSRTWTLPQDDPSTVSGKFLTTDASGVLSFAVGSGSGMTEVIDDTTPQLGGDLDVNGQDIIAIDGDIELLLDSPTLLESWTQEQKIVADNAGSTDEFGWAVAVSGDTAIVGAPWEDTGADNAGSAYIFIRTGTTWTLQQRIQGGTTGGDDRFGWGVGIDGDTCIIGAYKDDVAAYNAGAAFIFTRSGSTWTEQQHIYASDAQDSDSFGKTVAISGDTCIVGADEEDTGQSTAGAAYIFTRSGLTWTEQQKIQAGTPNQSGRFGSSVDIDGDSCIVGSYNEDSTASGGGAAYVFTRSGVTWTEQQRLLSSDIEADDYFGWSVGIDGDICIVGAYYEDTGADNAGAAYVFTRSDVTWTQQQKIQSETPETNEQFGYSVDISNDTIIIGARYENFGTAHIIVYSGGSWTEQQTITAGDGESGDWFGTSVAIDNDVCIVGAPDEDAGGSSAGAAYMFDHDYSSLGNIVLTSSSFVSTQLQFSEAYLGTESIGLKSPNSIITSRTWTLPQDDPSTASGTFLTTDASGVMSFASAATAPAGDDTEIQFNDTGSFGSSSSFTISNTTMTAGDTITVGNATGGRIQTATSQLLVIQPGLGLGQMSIRGAQNDSGNGGLTVIQGGYSPNNTAGETQVNGATSGGAGSTGGIISMVMGRGVTNDGWVELNPAGTGTGDSPVIRMYSDRANQAYYTAITSGNGLTASRTWTLPQDDPASSDGYFLKTDASGNMSFAIPSGTGMAEVLDDTSPQLGGNLDVNGFDIRTADGITVSTLRIQGGHITGGSSSAVTIVSSGNINSAATTITGNLLQVIGGHNLRTSGTAVGGSVSVVGGNASDSGLSNGVGGNIEITGGLGYQNGGDIIITPGNVGTGTAYGEIQIKGATSSAVAPIFFLEAVDNGLNYVALEAPDLISTNRIWTLPQDDPSTAAGNFMTTDASGVMSFTGTVDGGSY